jgi:hypothetical protein
MTEYLILIYEDEASWAEAGQEMFAENNAAALRGGNALNRTETATSVRKDPSGGFVVTDGPFAEAKETLGGYYLVEAADLDEAIAIARQVPAPFGGVEIRPVMVFD